jgi:hypothetical protein
VVDSSQRWDAAPLQKQQDFFEEYIEEYPRNQKKVVVIISDAMRYGVGEELLDRIKSEDRYTAELDGAVTMLPSYTQLGMATLLPHEKIVLNDNGTVLILQPHLGIEARQSGTVMKISSPSLVAAPPTGPGKRMIDRRNTAPN